MLEQGEPPPTSAGDAPARPPALVARRFALAALLGSALALCLDVLMLSAGHGTLLHDSGSLGTFFDVQARALLHGHLDVPPGALVFEGFVTEGRTYMYYGPVPAVLRLPVLAVTHSLDGRLAPASMLLALVVLLAAGAQAHWRIRALVRPGAEARRPDLVAVFLLQLALGAGAVPLFLASWTVVYHETELWGAALALAALSALIGVVAEPTAPRIAAAALLATLAVNTRVSVGLGPILAAAILAMGAAAQLAAGAPRRRDRRRANRLMSWIASFGPRAPAVGGRTVALLAAAALVPLLTSAAVNEAKFRTPFGIPIDRQVTSRIDANRKAVLAANGNTIFGLQFMPTTTLAMARPDALGLMRAFPWLALPRDPPDVIGSVRFDTLQQSLSAPTSMPLLCLLALIGLVVLVRRRPLRPLLGLLVGAAGGFVTSLTIAFVTTRYLADFLPFLMLGALVGLHAVLGGPRARTWPVLAVVGALTLAGILVNGSVGLVGARLLNPEVSEAGRAAFVREQDGVDRFLGRRPRGVGAGAELPRRATRLGDLWVLDRCAGLYVAGFGGLWLPVERTARAGVHRLAVRWAPRRSAAPEALVTLGRGPRRVTVVTRRDADSLRVDVRVGGRTAARGRRLPLPSASPTPVTVRFDAFGPAFAVRVDVAGQLAVSRPAPYARRGAVALGTDPDDPALHRLRGAVAAVPVSASTCRRLAGRAGIVIGGHERR